MFCRKHRAGVFHCEPFDYAQDKLREAISNATMAFSSSYAGDCHGPSGLAMTDCGSFLQSISDRFYPCKVGSESLYYLVRQNYWGPMLDNRAFRAGNRDF